MLGPPKSDEREMGIPAARRRGWDETVPWAIATAHMPFRDVPTPREIGIVAVTGLEWD